MDSKYENILLSKPFTFIVGPQKKHYVMHEAAVSRLCKTLGQLMGGGMKESNERCVNWEDLDEKTFLRFGEWAYTGDYQAEEPEILLGASQIATAEDDGATEKQAKKPVDNSLASLVPRYLQHCGQRWRTLVDNTCSCGRSYSAFRCQSCSTSQNTSCYACRGSSTNHSKKKIMIADFAMASRYASPTTIHRPRKNTESCEDYSDVFLSHALLYTLADKYDIPELRKLSMHKLYVTLKEYTVFRERIGDIVGLVSYSFKNTVPGDMLRTLMVEFCACIVEHLCESKEFQDMINETPDFAFQLIRELGYLL